MVAQAAASAQATTVLEAFSSGLAQAICSNEVGWGAHGACHRQGRPFGKAHFVGVCLQVDRSTCCYLSKACPPSPPQTAGAEAIAFASERCLLHAFFVRAS